MKPVANRDQIKGSGREGQLFRETTNVRYDATTPRMPQHHQRRIETDDEFRQRGQRLRGLAGTAGHIERSAQSSLLEEISQALKNQRMKIGPSAVIVRRIDALKKRIHRTLPPKVVL
jgi:hypothetical protein